MGNLASGTSMIPYNDDIYVPDNDFARLMYFLRSITQSIGIYSDGLRDAIPSEFLRPHYYHLLNKKQTTQLVLIALAARGGIAEMLDNLIFIDDQHKVIPGGKDLQFFEINKTDVTPGLQLSWNEAVCIRVTGTKRKILVCTSAWMKRNYLDPMERFGNMKHCPHCTGTAPPCTCSECEYLTESRCRPSQLDGMRERLQTIGALERSQIQDGVVKKPEAGSISFYLIGSIGGILFVMGILIDSAMKKPATDASAFYLIATAVGIMFLCGMLIGMLGSLLQNLRSG